MNQSTTRAFGIVIYSWKTTVVDVDEPQGYADHDVIHNCGAMDDFGNLFVVHINAIRISLGITEE